MVRKKSEKKNNGNGFRAVIYTLGLVALAIVILGASSFIMPSFGRAMREGRFDRYATPPPEGGIILPEENAVLRLGLSALNVALAAYLLYIYVKDYLALRSTFTLGLVAFLFSFLLYALSSFPLVRVLGPYGMASSLSFVPMLFSAIGLLIFAKLSNE